jgi:hypothetical protein
VSGRIVAVGIRITYIGALTNEAGTYFALTSESHNSLAGAAQSDIGAFQTPTIRPVTREPLILSAYPISDTEDQMAASVLYTETPSIVLYPWGDSGGNWSTTYGGNTAYTFANSGSNSDINMSAPIMSINIAGPVLAPFLVEIIQHVEYVGQQAGPMLKRADTDSKGADIVRNAVRTTQIDAATRPWINSEGLWKFFHGAARNLLHEAAARYVPEDFMRLRIEN